MYFPLCRIPAWWMWRVIWKHDKLVNGVLFLFRAKMRVHLIYFILNSFSKNNSLVHKFLLFQLPGVSKPKHQEFMYLKLKQIYALMTCMFIGYFLMQHDVLISQGTHWNTFCCQWLPWTRTQFKKEFLNCIRFMLQWGGEWLVVSMVAVRKYYSQSHKLYLIFLNGHLKFLPLKVRKTWYF